MKFIEPVNKRKYLLVFVHGLIGGEDTWVRKDGNKSLMEYLVADEQIRASFDVALYKYDTTLFDITHKLRYFVGLVTRIIKRFTRNLSIEKNAELFINELEGAKDYEGIVIISHSMGGLISKQVVLNEIERSNERKITPRIGLYISLATPHSGAELASLGKLFSSSDQIKCLVPTDEYILKLSESWVQCRQLPKRIYARGLNDQIVPRGANAIDAEKNYPISSNDDHFTILVPTPETKHVLNKIKDACIDFLQDNGVEVERSKHIDVPEPLRQPPRKQWHLNSIILVIIILAAYFVWKKTKPNSRICTNSRFIDSTGLVAYYTSSTENKTEGNMGLQFPKDSIIPSLEINSGNPNERILKFNLSENKKDWTSLVVGFNREIYDSSKAIIYFNKANWELLSDTASGKVYFKFKKNLKVQQPIFKIRI